MNDRLHFFDPTAFNEALQRELEHPSGTMDDPLTAAFAQMQHQQPAPAEASTELGADGPSAPVLLMRAGAWGAAAALLGAIAAAAVMVITRA